MNAYSAKFRNVDLNTQYFNKCKFNNYNILNQTFEIYKFQNIPEMGPCPYGDRSIPKQTNLLIVCYCPTKLNPWWRPPWQWSLHGQTTSRLCAPQSTLENRLRIEKKSENKFNCWKRSQIVPNLLVCKWDPKWSS